MPYFFAQVHMFSYQCSQLSTPESVIEVFNTARRFQKNQDITKYVSVVVLDEVGLAEDSPSLPLKALHPLLEDGTEGEDEVIVEREKRVAFIGISNWALDPAKMNRGVMVTRGDPDVHELEVSASSICSNKVDDPVRKRLQPYFKHLAAAYIAIVAKQKREFFGLRDFYRYENLLFGTDNMLQIENALSLLLPIKASSKCSTGCARGHAILQQDHNWSMLFKEILVGWRQMASLTPLRNSGVG